MSEISQKARDAAASAMFEDSEIFRLAITSGMMDDHKFVQAFAQFQRQIEAATVERCAKVAETYGLVQADLGQPEYEGQSGFFGLTIFDNRRGNESAIATAIRAKVKP